MRITAAFEGVSDETAPKDRGGLANLSQSEPFKGDQASLATPSGTLKRSHQIQTSL